MFSASQGFALGGAMPDPPPCLYPFDPAEGFAPDPCYRLVLRACHVLSRPTFHFFPTPMTMRVLTIQQNVMVNRNKTVLTADKSHRAE